MRPGISSFIVHKYAATIIEARMLPLLTRINAQIIKAITRSRSYYHILSAISGLALNFTDFLAGISIRV